MEDKELDQLFIDLQTEKHEFSRAEEQWELVRSRLSPKRKRLFYVYLITGIIMLLLSGNFLRNKKEQEANNKLVEKSTHSEIPHKKSESTLSNNEVASKSPLTKRVIVKSTSSSSLKEKDFDLPKKFKNLDDVEISPSTGYSSSVVTDRKQSINSSLLLKDENKNTVTILPENTEYLLGQELELLKWEKNPKNVGSINPIQTMSQSYSSTNFKIGLGVYKQFFDYEGVDVNEGFSMSLFAQYNWHKKWSIYSEISRYTVNRIVHEKPDEYNFPNYNTGGLITFDEASLMTKDWNIEIGLRYAFLQVKNLQISAYSSPIFTIRNGKYSYSQFVDYAMSTVETSYNGKRLEIDDIIIGLNTSFQWNKIGAEIFYGYYIPVNSTTLNWADRHKLGMRWFYQF